MKNGVPVIETQETYPRRELRFIIQERKLSLKLLSHSFKVTLQDGGPNRVSGFLSPSPALCPTSRRLCPGWSGNQGLMGDEGGLEVVGI